MGSGSKQAAIQIDACVSRQVLSLTFVAVSLSRTAQDWSLLG